MQIKEAYMNPKNYTNEMMGGGPFPPNAMPRGLRVGMPEMDEEYARALHSNPRMMESGWGAPREVMDPAVALGLSLKHAQGIIERAQPAPRLPNSSDCIEATGLSQLCR